MRLLGCLLLPIENFMNNENKQIARSNLDFTKIRYLPTSEWVKTLFDMAPLYVEAWELRDGEFKIVDCNKYAVNTYGLSEKEEFFGEGFISAPEYQPCGTLSDEKVKSTLAKALAEGSVRLEYTLLSRAGEEMPFEFTIARVPLEGRDILVCFGYDLRPAIEAEKQRVIDEIAALEREKQFKENLLATISHKLRTPLAVMSVYAEMAVRQLKSGTITEEVLDALDTIVDEAHRLAKLASSAEDMFDESRAHVDTRLTKGPFTLDLLSNQAFLDEHILDLTNIEFRLLHFVYIMKVRS